jgi:hypothetical protein
MTGPAIQLYFGEWRRNVKLRRCSWAARGVLVDVMGFMHDSDEYGALRWPLVEIATAVGCPLKLVRELAEKGVLKGSDEHVVPAYRWAPSHAGKRGPEVVLVQEQHGPLWYSSRMIRDEYIRTKRGLGTRFGSASKLPTATPSGTPSQRNGDGEGSQNSPPTRRGGDGASSASALNQHHVGESPTVPSPRPTKTENHGASSPSNGQTGAWWKTDQGIDAKAKELGLHAARGEDYGALKQRCFDEDTRRKRAR